MYEFRVTIEEADWNPNAGGWTCAALRLPGSTVLRVYGNGEKLPGASFEREGDVLRWRAAGVRPQALSVDLTIKLGARLAASAVGAALAGALFFAFASNIVRPKPPTLPQVAACRSAVSRLKTNALLPDQTLSGLAAAVQVEAVPCEDLFDALDQGLLAP